MSCNFFVAYIPTYQTTNMAQITKEIKNFQGLGFKMATLYADDQAFLDTVSDITLVVGYRE